MSLFCSPDCPQHLPQSLAQRIHVLDAEKREESKGGGKEGRNDHVAMSGLSSSHSLLE